MGRIWKQVIRIRKEKLRRKRWNSKTEKAIRRREDRIKEIKGRVREEEKGGGRKDSKPERANVSKSVERGTSRESGRYGVERPLRVTEKVLRWIPVNA